jgi:hypothetical protein
MVTATLIKIALAHFADSSRTSHKVQEEPVAAVRSEDLVHNECVHIALAVRANRVPVGRFLGEDAILQSPVGRLEVGHSGSFG